MDSFSRSHLTDRDLLALGAGRNARLRSETAAHVADIAEIEKRRLHCKAGHQYLVDFLEIEWRMSRDEAYNRSHAARTAVKHPAILEMLADGRLHLTGVNLLARHLTPGNATELLNAAAHKTKAEIEWVLAQRFPVSETMPLAETYSVSAMAPPSTTTIDTELAASGQASVQTMSQIFVPEREKLTIRRSRVVPVAQQRVGLTLTMSQEAHEKLLHAADLLSHRVPSGDLAQVIEHLLDAVIPLLEKRKFSATGRPREARKAPSHGRRLPADVQRRVWERDGGQCTFVSDGGRRCGSRRLLEFDHIVPVGRGGQSTVDNLRLRCRAHNQLEAERVYGEEFMRVRREQAAAAREQTELLISCLRRLGYDAADSKRAAEFAGQNAGLTLEERVKKALTWFRPRAFSVNQTTLAPSSTNGLRFLHSR